MDSLRYKESNYSFVFYGLFLFVTVYIGSMLLVKSENNDFYMNFMLKWKHMMLDYQHSGIPLPQLDKKSPVKYMRQLSTIIYNRDLADKNPQFMHKVKLTNGQESKVFLLAQQDALHIYGLDKALVDSLDKMIDGQSNLASGHWLAFEAKNSETYHAIWFYKKG